MNRVFLAEQLTAGVLRRFAPEIAAASVCSAIHVPDSAAATAVLADPRWRVGTIPLWEQAQKRLAEWSQDLVYRQAALETRLDRALIACGLDGRLRHTALAVHFYEYCRSFLAVPPEEVELDLVVSDPYLRDAFASGSWLAPRPRRIRFHAPPEAPLGPTVRSS